MAPRETVGEAIPATVKTATDIAEDFNLGGRGHRASPEEVGGPSAPVRLKIE
jgi:hypothetical protein